MEHKNLHHLFIPCKLADEMRILGFDEPCIAMYDDDCGLEDLSMWVDDEENDHFQNSMWNEPLFIAAPTWDQAFAWILKKLDRHSITRWDDWSGTIGDMSRQSECYFGSKVECLEILIGLCKNEIRAEQ